MADRRGRSRTRNLPTVKILEKIYTVVIGEQVKLECSISGTSRKTTVSWQRILPEGKTVTLNIDEIKYTGSKLNNPHLVINNIKKDDEGDYVCTVSNTHGKGQNATTTLKVKGGLPTLSMSRAEHNANEGEAAVLKCYISAKPEANAITWFKKEEESEREIKTDNDKYIGGNNSALVIDKTTKLKDEGIYICEADNIAGSGSNSVLLKIKSKTENAQTIAEAAAQNQEICEALDEKIKTRHSEMVNELADHLYRNAPRWEPFKQMLSTFLKPADLGKDDLRYYVAKLMDDEVIKFGEYAKLENMVQQVHKRASRIIEKAESDIKALKDGNNDSALEEDESSMKKDTNVIKQERHVVSAVKMDSFTDQDTKTSMIVPYKTNPEKLVEEQIAHEHAKLVTELTEYVSPKLDTWSTFRESLKADLPPPYVGENLDSIVNHLIKKQIIQFGQYQKLYDVVNQFDRTASIIIKKAEARMKAIQAKEDCSDGEDDISSIKEDIGSMKMDILAIKQDVAIIRQIVGTVKTESTTDKEHETSNMDEVSSMMKGVSSVKKELNVGTRSAIRGTCRLLAQKYNLRDDCVVLVTDASNQEDLIIIYDPSCNTERKLKEFGEDVMIRNPTFVSPEGAIVSSICKTKPYFVTPEDKINLKQAINQHTKRLFASHSNLNIITTSPVKSRNKGADIIECPCIVLVCSSKGYIPVGESRFPEELICENMSFVVDVREGYCQFCPSSYSTFDGSFFHQNIKMGCSFGIEGTQNAGTIGPFVDDFQGHQLFLTCAHIVNGVDQNGYDLNFIPNMFAEQPDALKFPNPQIQGGIPQRCGQVRRALFLPNNPISVDAAVVEITEQSRLPSRGEFAVDSELTLKAAGFDDVPRFESGEIHDNPDKLETDLRVVKFGAKTHVTRGSINSLGTSAKPLTTDLGLQGQTERCLIKNQYEVLSIRGHSDFFLPGDSGSGVFAVNKLPTGEQKLTCIGMAIGCTSYGSAVVTPIAAVLDALGLPKTLKQFP